MSTENHKGSNVKWIIQYVIVPIVVAFIGAGAGTAVIVSIRTESTPVVMPTSVVRVTVPGTILPTETVTPVPTNTPSPTATNTPLPIPTDTLGPPTLTPTNTPAPTDTPSPTATNTPIPTQSVSVSCNEEGKLSFSNLPSVPPFGCVLAVEWWYPRDIAKGCGLWFDVKPISFNEGVDGYWWYITPERVITHTMQYQAKTGNAICKVKDFTR